MRTPNPWAAALALALFGPALRAEGPAPYADPDGLFSLEAPGGWDQFSDSGSQTKNVTFQLVTPKAKGSDEKVSYAVTVFYYAPDNANFRSPEEYIRFNSLPSPSGASTPVEDLRISAGPARRWSATGPGPRTPDVGSDFTQKETFVLLPAKKGFFVLLYASPEDLHGKQMKAFLRVLDSFTPSAKA